MSYLQEAAREGDCLIVAVNSDASVRQLGKGPDRPVFAEQQRAAMLAALEAVDYVTIFGEATPHALLALEARLFVKGGSYAPHEIVGHELVEAYGGQVKALAKCRNLEHDRPRTTAEFQGSDLKRSGRQAA